MTSKAPIRDEILKHLRAGKTREQAWFETQKTFKRYPRYPFRKAAWGYVCTIARQFERGELR